MLHVDRLWMCDANETEPMYSACVYAKKAFHFKPFYRQFVCSAPILRLYLIHCCRHIMTRHNHFGNVRADDSVFIAIASTGVLLVSHICDFIAFDCFFLRDSKFKFRAFPHIHRMWTHRLLRLRDYTECGLTASTEFIYKKDMEKIYFFYLLFHCVAIII